MYANKLCIHFVDPPMELKKRASEHLDRRSVELPTGDPAYFPGIPEHPFFYNGVGCITNQDQEQTIKSFRQEFNAKGWGFTEKEGYPVDWGRNLPFGDAERHYTFEFTRQNG